jgi:hypothetical protein
MMPRIARSRAVKSQARFRHINRLVIALHSPATFAETGLLTCPSEKTAAKLADKINHDIFSGPVSTDES